MPDGAVSNAARLTDVEHFLPKVALGDERVTRKTLCGLAYCTPPGLRILTQHTSALHSLDFALQEAG